MVGLLILLLTSLPVSLEHGAGLGGFIAAILVIGVGTGGIKSNVSPLIADQYQRKKMAIKTIAKTGERVINCNRPRSHNPAYISGLLLLHQRWSPVSLGNAIHGTGYRLLVGISDVLVHVCCGSRRPHHWT